MDANRIRQLLDKRDDIDREIQAIVMGKQKKPVQCSQCQEEGHTARNCPSKSAPAAVPALV